MSTHTHPQFLTLLKAFKESQLILIKCINLYPSDLYIIHNTHTYLQSSGGSGSSDGCSRWFCGGGGGD